MMKTQKLMLILTGVILTIFFAGGWYIFIAGAPQLDPPQIETHSELKFQLESFYSSSMQEHRQYGVILPSHYYQHPERRYPVIFLLHGGHDNSDAYY